MRGMPRFRPEPLGDVHVALSRNRRAIANAMSLSAAIPQFCLDAEVDLRSLTAQRSGGASFSIGDAVMRASALALSAHRELNASFVADEIVRHEQVNIGLGVIGPDGLIVVVFRDADRLSLVELANERQRLSEAAANGQLRGEEVLGATFIVSNLGPAGVSRFQALVVPPTAAILAIGAVTERLRLSNGQPEGYPGMTLCLSCDHRVADGMEGARFLRTLVHALEHPEDLG